ncbi:MAG: enoyl-CoA hydratase [Hyphomicrobium sp.]|nr:enoyl-CoA hydratase [Hyphomicrobium sp.]
MTAAAPFPPPAVRFAVDEGIATLSFDNPNRMNALTAAMWAAIPEFVAEATARDDVRVLVVRGAGEKAFSAGADISEFGTARTGDAARTYDALNEAAFNAIIGLEKPSIAMIHGFCLGGGLGIAACCDLRIADSSAEFAIPAAKLGIGYDPRWLRTLLALAPPSRVKELLFTGRRFSADEALAMGLLNRVLSADALEGATAALAAEIAGNAPLTIKAAKKAIDELVRRPESADIDRLGEYVRACFESADYREGRTAFMEKRKPRFSGN